MTSREVVMGPGPAMRGVPAHEPGEAGVVIPVLVAIGVGVAILLSSLCWRHASGDE